MNRRNLTNKTMTIVRESVSDNPGPRLWTRSGRTLKPNPLPKPISGTGADGEDYIPDCKKAAEVVLRGAQAMAHWRLGPSEWNRQTELCTDSRGVAAVREVDRTALPRFPSTEWSEADQRRITKERLKMPLALESHDRFSSRQTHNDPHRHVCLTNEAA